MATAEEKSDWLSCCFDYSVPVTCEPRGYAATANALGARPFWSVHIPGAGAPDERLAAAMGYYRRHEVDATGATSRNYGSGSLTHSESGTATREDVLVYGGVHVAGTSVGVDPPSSTLSKTWTTDRNTDHVVQDSQGQDVTLTTTRTSSGSTIDGVTTGTTTTTTETLNEDDEIESDTVVTNSPLANLVDVAGDPPYVNTAGAGTYTFDFTTTSLWDGSYAGDGSEVWSELVTQSDLASGFAQAKAELQLGSTTCEAYQRPSYVTINDVEYPDYVTGCEFQECVVDFRVSPSHVGSYLKVVYEVYDEEDATGERTLVGGGEVTYTGGGDPQDPDGASWLISAQVALVPPAIGFTRKLHVLKTQSFTSAQWEVLNKSVTEDAPIE